MTQKNQNDTKRITLDAEGAFLALLAKRLLRNQRDAEQRGEVYHDLSSPARLKCGIEAKIVFESTAYGYKPVLTLHEKEGLTSEELAKAATELLGIPTRLRESNSGVLKFEPLHEQTDVVHSS